MKSLFIKLFIIFIYLISSSSAYSIEVPKIKNLILHKQPKKLENIEFQNINNKLMKLNDFKDKFLIINFWATWCAPCRKEMPSLEKLSIELPEIDIFAVNMEKPNNIKVDKFFKDIGVKDLKTYYDPELRLVKGFKLRGLPTSILINKEGKEFGKVIGEIDFASDEFINLLKKYI